MCIMYENLHLPVAPSSFCATRGAARPLLKTWIKDENHGFKKICVQIKSIIDIINAYKKKIKLQQNVIS